MAFRFDDYVLRDDRNKKSPPRHSFRQLTREDVLSPDFGRQQLYIQDQQGFMARVRVNGRVKTWKRDPSRIEIPVKFGMYDAFRVTDPAELFVMEAPNAVRRGSRRVFAGADKTPLSVPDKHRLKIARQTLRMRPEMVPVMGGMSIAEAHRAIYELTGKWAPGAARHFHPDDTRRPRENAPSGWGLRQDVTYPHWVRAWESRDGTRRYVYDVTPVQTGKGSRYEVSYRRADGDFDIRYRAAGGTGGYVGQARTRDAGFKMAARHANRAGLVSVRENPMRKKLRSVGRRKVVSHRTALRYAKALAAHERAGVKEGKRQRKGFRQSLRVVARGVTRDVARAFGGRLPRGFRKNPMSRKDFELMAALIAQAQINGASEGALIALTDFAVELGKSTNPRFDADRFARRIVQLVGEGKPFRYVNRGRANPLAIYGALAGNPPRGGVHAELGRCIEIRYKRKDDGGFYYHRFKTRPRLLALSDGTLAVRP